MNQRSNKDLKKLQAVWYKKLKEQGFEDIENTNLEGEPLIFYHSTRFTTAYHPLFFSQRQEYYRLAGLFLYDHAFDTKEEVLIWQEHADGLSIVKIARKLNLKNYVVHRIIQKLSRLLLKANE